MTNREWLETLSDEDFAIVIGSCGSCVGYGTGVGKCTPSCPDGKLQWLRQEHKKDPNLKLMKEKF